MTNTKTRQQRLEDAKKRLDEFCSNTMKCYVLVEDIIEVNERFNNDCEETKEIYVTDKRMAYKVFDGMYEKQTQGICDLIAKADIDISDLDIFKNVLYENDCVDNKLMMLALLCWCRVNSSKYPPVIMYDIVDSIGSVVKEIY